MVPAVRNGELEVLKDARQDFSMMGRLSGRAGSWESPEGRENGPSKWNVA